MPFMYCRYCTGLGSLRPSSVRTRSSRAASQFFGHMAVAGSRGSVKNIRKVSTLTAKSVRTARDTRRTRKRAMLPVRLRVEGVAQGVAEEVERQYQDENGDAREQDVGGVGLQVAEAVEDHPAEVGGRLEDADAEERQRRLAGDVRGNRQRERDQDRRGEVGQQFTEEDAAQPRAGRAGRLDELAFAQRQDLAADEAGGRRPAERGEQQDEHGDAEP